MYIKKQNKDSYIWIKMEGLVELLKNTDIPKEEPVEKTEEQPKKKKTGRPRTVKSIYTDEQLAIKARIRLEQWHQKRPERLLKRLEKLEKEVVNIRAELIQLGYDV